MDIKLSILIPSIPERASCLARLVNELQRQSDRFPVEILTFVDNKKRSIGTKRNDLIQQAKGDFVVFVDDDDRVSTDYIDSLMSAIRQTPDADCITFDVEVSLGGIIKKICKYDIVYGKDKLEDEQYYYRNPNHIMCFSKKLASQYHYLDMSFGEDTEWAVQVRNQIQKQEKIPKVLYYYDYMFKREGRYKGLENYIMLQALKQEYDL
ncbi:Glycosyltransferase like family 2 [Thermoactinomyces sp. DSM 45891]|uniref:glycosyltransferase n=1 Tax=Thermoactinomyces sp. DSM 45891 TaxID=1761907 RepID=UPI0009121002|nr:glycosyltransferase [Thermoactinomyces sp. DSM 45891]SFX06452.1 Glycosyltransferase like family 2 [Thermoactinomyces sp. DSM 45891]